MSWLPFLDQQGRGEVDAEGGDPGAAVAQDDRGVAGGHDRRLAILLARFMLAARPGA